MKRPFVQYASLEPHFEKNNYLSNLSGQSGGEGGIPTTPVELTR